MKRYAWIAKTDRGFVLPVVLALTLIATALTVTILQNQATVSAIATQRQLHLRAFENANSGVDQALARMPAPIPARYTARWASPTRAPESAEVIQQHIHRLGAPVGYSSERIAQSLHEVASTGHAARGARVTVVQGFTVLSPAP